MSPLRTRVLSSGKWTVISQIFTNLARLVSTLILARLLLPEDFALSATAAILMMAATMLSDVGLAEAVIRSARGEEDEFLNTAWAIQITRGCALFVITNFVALILYFCNLQGWFAHGTVYADKNLPGIVALTGLTLLLQGFQSTNYILARRNLDFRRIAQMGIISQASSIVITIVLAYTMRSAYALAIGNIFAASIHLILSHRFLQGITNKWHWEQSAALELKKTGQWIIITSAIGFFAANADRVVLGLVFTANLFGQFHIATQLIAMVTMLYLNLCSGVMMPALSEIRRSNPSGVAAAYLKFQRYTDTFLFASAGILMVSSHAIVNLMYDDGYAAAGGFLGPLTLGIIGHRSRLIENLYIIDGQSHRLIAPTLARALAMVTLVPGAFHLFGVDAAAAAAGLSAMAGWPFTMKYAGERGLGQWRPAAFALPALAAGWVIGGVLRIALVAAGVAT